MRMNFDALIIGTATVALAGCGGAGGGGVQSMPNPITVAPPPPSSPSPPPSPPPLPTGPIGLQSNAPFATQAAHLDASGFNIGSDAVEFSYSSSDNAYTITVPHHSPGRLVTIGGNGSYNATGWTHLQGTHNQVQSQPVSAPVTVNLDWPGSSTLTYTSVGEWAEGGAFPINRGFFAYGIPTTAGDVPVSGAGTYTAAVRGMTEDGTFVGGSVALAFDFGAGTLSGAMKPVLYPWDAYPLGTYTFRDTVYSSGSTTFSGAFIVPGSNAPSSFSGNFTGPQAAEFMASWRAPYVYSNGGPAGTMAGVWTGKKD